VAAEEDDGDEGYLYKKITPRAHNYFFTAVKEYEKDELSNNVKYSFDQKDNLLNEKLMAEYSNNRDSSDKIIAKETRKYFSTDRGYNIDPFLIDLNGKANMKGLTEEEKQIAEEDKLARFGAREIAINNRLVMENEQFAFQRPVVIRKDNAQMYMDGAKAVPYTPITQDALDKKIRAANGFLISSETDKTTGPIWRTRQLCYELIEQFEEYIDVGQMIENQTTEFFKTQKGYNIDPFIKDLKQKKPPDPPEVELKGKGKPKHDNRARLQEFFRTYDKKRFL
jgi:hypothetical protein